MKNIKKAPSRGHLVNESEKERNREHFEQFGWKKAPQNVFAAECGRRVVIPVTLREVVPFDPEQDSATLGPMQIGRHGVGPKTKAPRRTLHARGADRDGNPSQARQEEGRWHWAFLWPTADDAAHVELLWLVTGRVTRVAETNLGQEYLAACTLQGWDAELEIWRVAVMHLFTRMPRDLVVFGPGRLTSNPPKPANDTAGPREPKSWKDDPNDRAARRARGW